MKRFFSIFITFIILIFTLSSCSDKKIEAEYNPYLVDILNTDKSYIENDTIYIYITDYKKKIIAKDDFIFDSSYEITLYDSNGSEVGEIIAYDNARYKLKLEAYDFSKSYDIIISVRIEGFQEEVFLNVKRQYYLNQEYEPGEVSITFSNGYAYKKEITLDMLKLIRPILDGRNPLYEVGFSVNIDELNYKRDFSFIIEYNDYSYIKEVRGITNLDIEATYFVNEKFSGGSCDIKYINSYGNASNDNISLYDGVVQIDTSRPGDYIGVIDLKGYRLEFPYRVLDEEYTLVDFKDTYLLNEEFKNPKIKHRNSDAIEYINITKDMVKGFDSANLGCQEITILVNGKEIKRNITIINNDTSKPDSFLIDTLAIKLYTLNSIKRSEAKDSELLNLYNNILNNKDKYDLNLYYKILNDLSLNNTEAKFLDSFIFNEGFILHKLLLRCNLGDGLAIDILDEALLKDLINSLNILFNNIDYKKLAKIYNNIDNKKYEIFDPDNNLYLNLSIDSISSLIGFKLDSGLTLSEKERVMLGLKSLVSSLSLIDSNVLYNALRKDIHSYTSFKSILEVIVSVSKSSSLDSILDAYLLTLDSASNLSIYNSRIRIISLMRLINKYKDYMDLDYSLIGYPEFKMIEENLSFGRFFPIFIDDSNSKLMLNVFKLLSPLLQAIYDNNDYALFMEVMDLSHLNDAKALVSMVISVSKLDKDEIYSNRMILELISDSLGFISPRLIVRAKDDTKSLIFKKGTSVNDFIEEFNKHFEIYDKFENVRYNLDLIMLDNNLINLDNDLNTYGLHKAIIATNKMYTGFNFFVVDKNEDLIIKNEINEDLLKYTFYLDDEANAIGVKSNDNIYNDEFIDINDILEGLYITLHSRENNLDIKYRLNNLSYSYEIIYHDALSLLVLHTSLADVLYPIIARRVGNDLTGYLINDNFNSFYISSRLNELKLIISSGYKIIKHTLGSNEEIIDGYINIDIEGYSLKIKANNEVPIIVGLEGSIISIDIKSSIYNKNQEITYIDSFGNKVSIKGDSFYRLYKDIFDFTLDKENGILNVIYNENIISKVSVDIIDNVKIKRPKYSNDIAMPLSHEAYMDLYNNDINKINDLLRPIVNNQFVSFETSYGYMSVKNLDLFLAKLNIDYYFKAFKLDNHIDIFIYIDNIKMSKITIYDEGRNYSKYNLGYSIAASNKYIINDIAKIDQEFLRNMTANTIGLVRFNEFSSDYFYNDELLRILDEMKVSYTYEIDSALKLIYVDILYPDGSLLIEYSVPYIDNNNVYTNNIYTVDKVNPLDIINLIEKEDIRLELPISLMNKRTSYVPSNEIKDLKHVKTSLNNNTYTLEFSATIYDISFNIIVNAIRVGLDKENIFFKNEIYLDNISYEDVINSLEFTYDNRPLLGIPKEWIKNNYKVEIENERVSVSVGEFSMMPLRVYSKDLIGTPKRLFSSLSYVDVNMKQIPFYNNTLMSNIDYLKSLVGDVLIKLHQGGSIYLKPGEYDLVVTFNDGIYKIKVSSMGLSNEYTLYEEKNGKVIDAYCELYDYNFSPKSSDDVIRNIERLVIRTGSGTTEISNNYLFIKSMISDIIITGNKAIVKIFDFDMVINFS